ncbi:MAG: DISARM system phospholipase D-like protein DrmC [Acidobacteriota bacterium]
MTDLTRLATADLEILARALSREEIGDLGMESLAQVGLGHLAEKVAPLRPLGSAAIHILRAVLAERARPTTSVELVWTGPEAGLRPTRDTAVVVRELFARARRSVVVGGFRFDHGEAILRPLHEVMRDHSVETSIFLDVERAPHGVDVRTHASRALDHFIDQNWPFGPPRPRLYYDPRTVEPDSVASLHAKCLVVDRRWALVSSANFTDRGQHRNIEAGVLVESSGSASRLAGQWLSLVSSGQMRSQGGMSPGFKPGSPSSQG